MKLLPLILPVLALAFDNEYMSRREKAGEYRISNCLTSFDKYNRRTPVDMDRLRSEGFPDFIDYSKHECSRKYFTQAFNTCWAVSTVGAAEIAYCMNAKGTERRRTFSAQFFSDCAETQCGEEASFMDDIFMSWILHNGFCSYKNYPYNRNTVDNGLIRHQCQGCEYTIKPRRILNLSCSSPEILIRALKKYGPLAVGMNFSSKLPTLYEIGDKATDYPTLSIEDGELYTDHVGKFPVVHAITMIGYYLSRKDENVPMFVLRESSDITMGNNNLKMVSFENFMIGSIAYAFDFTDGSHGIEDWELGLEVSEDIDPEQWKFPNADYMCTPKKKSTENENDSRGENKNEESEEDNNPSSNSVIVPSVSLALVASSLLIGFNNIF